MKIYLQLVNLCSCFAQTLHKKNWSSLYKHEKRLNDEGSYQLMEILSGNLHIGMDALYHVLTEDVVLNGHLV